MTGGERPRPEAIGACVSALRRAGYGALSVEKSRPAGATVEALPDAGDATLPTADDAVAEAADADAELAKRTLRAATAAAAAAE